ncbi:MAG: hypothetical protein Q9226_001785 [Calogaya cf. arnoldii]
MAPPKPTAPQPINPGLLPPAQSRSRLSHNGAASLIEAAIFKDLEDDADNAQEQAMSDTDAVLDDSDSADSFRQSRTQGKYGSMVSSYRRPSFTIAGSRATIAAPFPNRNRNPTKTERVEARREERSLLRDNNVIPPKHPQKGQASHSLGRRISRQFSNLGIPRGDKKVLSQDEESASPSTNPAHLPETTPLLGDPELPYGGQDSPENLDRKWTEAVAVGRIRTTWQREFKVLSRYSAPLIVTFLLQYSLTVASIFVVGHLGTVPLGAVSLASMTANITGYSVFQGLATSLDTLCAQAYGSGHKKMVGLLMQRMVYFLWTITIPIGIIWLSAEAILTHVVPEQDVAVLAGLYLKIILIGLPGYACFESGKRYLQAQGLFTASLYVLLICAPLNAFLNWLFVWQFQWGFIGAPIAVAITDTLLPIFLFLYVRFIAGRACWPGLTSRALKNWGPMVKLALPGLLMVEAEVLAFEILTLASSSLGTTHLAAQSVLATLTGITFQIPFPISIAASTRIANLIGATLADSARKTAQVAFWASTVVGIFNVIWVSSLRGYIPKLFTSDPDVIELVANVLPLCAAFQLFDALATCCNGILRGLGRQEIGGYVQVFCYYAIAIPISMSTAFGLGWGLYGLWSGVALALGLVASIEGVFLYRSSWERSVEDAKRRNAES